MIVDVLKIKFLGFRIPLAVRWDITSRCPWKCKYCQIWKLNIKEADTRSITNIISEMKKCGVVKISFSGGEPLLRDDICEIIKFAGNKKISPEMNTTGFGFPEKAKDLKAVDLLKISLDGEPRVNDFIRGKDGAYNCAIEAAEYARKYSIKFIFTTTLTGYNLDCLEFMLNLAEGFKTKVAFQPLKDIRYLKHGSLCEIDDRSLFPEEEKWKEAMRRLIERKKRNSGLMRNTLRGLKHIYNWPEYKKIACWGGRVFCMINPSGEVSPCDRLYYKGNLPNCISSGFREAVKEMPALPSCGGCGFCGSLELNHLMNSRYDCLSDIIRSKAFYFFGKKR